MLAPELELTLELVPAIIGPDEPRLAWPSGRPSGLTPPSVPLVLWGGNLTLAGGRPISYANVYASQPWVAAAVHGLARQIARLPWKAYEPVGEEGNRQRDRGSSLAELMRRPAPGRSALELKWSIAMGLLVHGSHLERIGRRVAGADPDRLERIDWRHVIPHLEHEGGPVVGWEHRPPNAGVEWLGPEEVVYWAWPGADGPLGVSPLAQLGVTIRAEDSAQRYGEASFRNGARVGVAAVLDKSVTADEAVRNGVREEIQLAHGGLEKAFTPIVLGGGVTDVKAVGGQSAVEAELINARRVNREEIAAVYGVPPPLIGILDHATYSNVAELHSMLYRTVLGPWLSLLSETVGAQLVARVPAWEAAGRFVEFDLGEVLKGDTRARMEAYRVAIAAGVLTLNDVRRLENLEPYADPRADEPLVMANNVLPLSQVGASPGPGSTGAGGDPLEDADSRAAVIDAVLRELEALELNGSARAVAERIAEGLAAR